MHPLIRRGVKFFPEQRYQEVAGKRTRVSLDGTLDRVWLPVTDAEWADVMIRERPDYLGGCCVALDEVQEHVLTMMRDDGMIKNADLLEIGIALRDHGGFDTAAKLTTPEYDGFIAEWDQFGIIDRLGIVFNAVEPLLKQRRHQLPQERDGDMIHTLSTAIVKLSWEDIFNLPTASEEDDAHARRLETKAKILPLLRDLFEQLEGDDEVIDGYALVAPGTDTVLSNMKGACIYASKESAEEVAEIWERSDQPEAAYDLREAKVSVADGVILGDKIEFSV